MPTDQPEPKPAAGDAEVRNTSVNQTLFDDRENQLSTHSEPRSTTAHMIGLIPPSVQHRRSVPLEFPLISQELSEVRASSILNDSTQLLSAEFDQSHRNNNLSGERSSHHKGSFKERKGCRSCSSTPHPRRLGGVEIQNVLTTQNESSSPEFHIAEGAISELSAHQKARMLSISSMIIALIYILLEAVFLLLCLRVKSSCSLVALFILQGSIFSIIIVILEFLKAYLCQLKTRLPEHSTDSGTNPISSVESPMDRIGIDRSIANGDYGMQHEKAAFHPAQFASNSVNQIIESHCCFYGKQVVLNVLATIFYCALIIVLLSGFFNIATESGKVENPAIINNTFNLNSTDKRLQVVCRTLDLNIGMIYFVIHLASVMLRAVVCWCLCCGGCVCSLMTKNKHNGAPRSMVPPIEAPFSSTLFPNRRNMFSLRTKRRRIGGNAESANS